MSAEPVKLVIILDGGLIQDVLSCGVPIQYVVIDYDVDGEPGDLLIPQPDWEGKPQEPEEAYVSAFDAELSNPAEALRLFHLVRDNEEVKHEAAR